MPKPQLKIVTDTPQPALSIKGLRVWIGRTSILSGIDLEVPKTGVTCLIGPSGAGKSTLLRALNRIDEDTPNYRAEGQISLAGKDISQVADLTELRRRVGMVFQRPCVFPRSIEKNVLFGVRGQKLTKSARAQIAETALRQAALWGEVSGRLSQNAQTLSLGQQQRLCIARALAISPEVLLLDEPTASIDPVSGRAIEDLVIELGKTRAVIMVTHNIAQAKRVADHAVFLCDGQIIEAGPAQDMFSTRSLPKTQTYIGEEFCDC